MLKRLLFRNYWVVSSIHYWVGRRFTRAGLLVLSGLLMTGGLAMDAEQSVAYQTFAFLFCLTIVAFVCAIWFRARFTINRVLPRFASAGQPFTYKLLLRNEGRKRQVGLVLLEDLSDPRLALRMRLSSPRPPSIREFLRNFRKPRRIRVAHTQEVSLPPLLPGRESMIENTLTPFKRGLLQLGGVTIARADPFGLFRAFRKFRLQQTVTVLPKRYALPAIALPGTLKYQQGGMAMASSVGESEEFVSLRDYRRGDPMRYIHWKSWAKTGRPIVKEFEDEFFVRHALILDTFTDPRHEEAFEEAVSIAASFACTIKTQESLLDLMFVGPQAFCFTAGRGLAHTEQMLEILAAVEICRDKPFRALQNLVLEHLTALSGCICILVDWDEERRELIRNLKALGLPLRVFLIVSPADRKKLEESMAGEETDEFHVLEVGKIQEGLHRL